MGEAFDKIFARFDHNHNGKVFVKDFFDELRQANFEVGDEEVEKLQSFADEEGQVTKDDFKHYCKHSELFQSLDKNSDGFISKREFNEISKTLTKEQIATVMVKFDQDGDGKLSYSEFKKLLKK